MQALALGLSTPAPPSSLLGCVYAQQMADDELAARIDQALLASDELNLSRIEVSAESGRGLFERHVRRSCK